MSISILQVKDYSCEKSCYEANLTGLCCEAAGLTSKQLAISSFRLVFDNGNLKKKSVCCPKAKMRVNDIYDDKIRPFSRAAVAKSNNRRNAKAIKQSPG